MAILTLAMCCFFIVACTLLQEAKIKVGVPIASLGRREIIIEMIGASLGNGAHLISCGGEVGCYLFIHLVNVPFSEKEELLAMMSHAASTSFNYVLRA